MQSVSMPCCYHPTTIVFVDDNPKFLNSLELRLSDQWVIKTFSNPFEALEYINYQHKPNPFTQRCLTEMTDPDCDHHGIDVNTKEIHREIYRRHRFQEISAVVVDYGMPGCDGIEFCKKIESKHVRRLMLTGEADYALGVEAFNKNIINQFIMKSRSDMIEQLTKSLKSLQQEFFIDYSNVVIQTLVEHSDYSSRCLKDPMFIEFFEHLCHTHRIVEYYMIDTSGSFLLLDAEANAYWLVVKNGTELDGLLDFASYDETPQTVLKYLQSREQLPFFFTYDDFQQPPPQWESYFHPTKILRGQEIYYYAFIDAGRNDYRLDNRRIQSYENMLNQYYG